MNWPRHKAKREQIEFDIAKFEEATKAYRDMAAALDSAIAKARGLMASLNKEIAQAEAERHRLNRVRRR